MNLVSRVLFCLMSVSLVLLIPILWGSLPPLNFYLTLCNQFSGFPQRPCLAKPLIGLSPAINGSSSCRRNLLPLVRRSPCFAIVEIRPPQSLFDSASSLSRDLEDARQSSSRPGVSSSAKPTSSQSGPSRPEFDPAVPGPSRRRSFDSPQRSLGHSSRQGSDTPPRKRRRLSGDSSEDEDSSSQARRQRDDQQDEEDNFRPASLDLLLKYITKKFPAACNPWFNLPPNDSMSWRLQVSCTNRLSSPPISPGLGI